MRILVLHSDIAPDAPADELDTIYSAEEVTKALTRQGHSVQQAAFIQDPYRFEAMLAKANPEVVFNLVEGIDGLGSKAPIAIRMLDEAGAVFGRIAGREAALAAVAQRTGQMAVA